MKGTTKRGEKLAPLWIKYYRSLNQRFTNLELELFGTVVNAKMSSIQVMTDDHALLSSLINSSTNVILIFQRGRDKEREREKEGGGNKRIDDSIISLPNDFYFYSFLHQQQEGNNQLFRLLSNNILECCPRFAHFTYLFHRWYLLFLIWIYIHRQSRHTHCLALLNQ